MSDDSLAPTVQEGEEENLAHPGRFETVGDLVAFVCDELGRLAKEGRALDIMGNQHVALALFELGLPISAIDYFEAIFRKDLPKIEFEIYSEEDGVEVTADHNSGVTSMRLGKGARLKITVAPPTRRPIKSPRKTRRS